MVLSGRSILEQGHCDSYLYYLIVTMVVMLDAVVEMKIQQLRKILTCDCRKHMYLHACSIKVQTTCHELNWNVLEHIGLMPWLTFERNEKLVSALDFEFCK